MRRTLRALRTAEACEVLDIDLITLYRRIKSGQQAARKEGSRWRVFVWEYELPTGPIYTAITKDEAIKLFGPEFVTVEG